MNASNGTEWQSQFGSLRCDRYNERSARWEARRYWKRGWSRGHWWLGAILILAGTVMMLENLGITISGNWWAYLLLIPALGSFEAAWRAYRFGSRFAAVEGPLIGGLLFTLLAAMFLFDLSWGLVWPVGLIVVGICKVLGGLWPYRSQR